MMKASNDDTIIIQVRVKKEFYNELYTAGQKLYGLDRGYKKLTILRCLQVGLDNMKAEIEKNKKEI
jgi:hypothetical protein